MALSVSALFPLPSNFTGINYTCLSICAAMQSERLRIELSTPMVRPEARRRFISSVVPQKITWLPYEIFKKPLDRLTVKSFLKKAKSKDAVYLWSAVPLEVTEALHDLGVVVIREKFNCHQAYARGVLDREYERLSLPTNHRINEQKIEKERKELELADYVFCPSPMVKHSLLQEGVPESKLLVSSYGWEPGRLRTLPDTGAKKESGVNVLFVGRLCVRKGVPRLLRAWVAAGIHGRLLLAGAIDDEIEETCGAQLARSDVTLLGHVRDVAQAYRQADIFVFPSLEEGGPLVTYEAMGAGLPVIVSPMGAGAIVKDNVHGFIRDPEDETGWVEALRKLAGSSDLRYQFGKSASNYALRFTWREVGAARESMVVDVLNNQ